MNKTKSRTSLNKSLKKSPSVNSLRKFKSPQIK